MRVKILCPNAGCGASYNVEDRRLGREARCKRCGRRFPLVPETQPTARRPRLRDATPPRPIARPARPATRARPIPDPPASWAGAGWGRSTWPRTPSLVDWWR